jgi:hypothetical protein
MSSFIAELGAKPAVIDFNETVTAFKDDLIDCGITSKASANHAGWAEYAKFNYPFAIQFGLNGYAITLEKWDSLTRDQQIKLQQVFDEHIQNIWKLSKALSDDSNNCHVGTKCTSDSKYQWSRSPVYQPDRALALQIMQNKILSKWGKECNIVQPSCRNDWDKRFLKIMNKLASKRLHSNT